MFSLLPHHTKSQLFIKTFAMTDTDSWIKIENIFKPVHTTPLWLLYLGNIIHIHPLSKVLTAGCCQCAHTASRCGVPAPGQLQSPPGWKVAALGWMRRGVTRGPSWLSPRQDPGIPPLSWSENGWGGVMVLDEESEKLNLLQTTGSVQFYKLP